MENQLEAPEGVKLVGTEPTVGEYINSQLTRVKSGDLGVLPIVAGLIVICAIFGTLSPVFFNSRNFVNLLLQMAGVLTIAIGVVFVLLIAEIDLSVAFVSGVGGVTMTLLLREEVSAWPWWAAIAAGLLATTLIGLIHGLIITKARVPSFVVTLAGLLAWSGVVLILTTELSTAGAIVIQNDVVLAIANQFLPATWGWALFGVVVVLFSLTKLLQRASLRRQNLPSVPLPIIIAQIVALAVITGFVVYYANTDRGVPVAAVIILVQLVFWSFIANRTKFGRYIYAVGGNPEAARRAGINVDNIRIAVFMISGFMAGMGGIILASRLRSVDTNTGGGNLLLNAIAAAVIGGTSLFGGSGRVVTALYGALIIAAVENGMGLLGLPSGVKFVVNGGVLLAAVLIDSFSRRSRESSGLA